MCAQQYILFSNARYVPLSVGEPADSRFGQARHENAEAPCDNTICNERQRVLLSSYV